MNFNINKQWIKSFLLMIISVIIMGFCVSLLVLVNMGTDPCSAMNYGISDKIGISFGTYQFLLNVVLLIFVIKYDRSLIGMGTLGNMILVGYSADFLSWLLHDICNVPYDIPLKIRIILLFPTLIVFVIAAACYMNSGHGMAPYDAVPFIISNKIEERTNKNPFKFARFCLDLFGTIIGFITKGESGVITILMVITLSPTISFVGNVFKKHGITK